MCGRYQIEIGDDEIRDIIEELNRRHLGGGPFKTGEIFPTDVAPIWVSEDGATAPRPVKWGFPRIGGPGVVINARSETAWEKNMFRGALTARRCVAFSSGFYEWKRTAGGRAKDKFLFREKNGGLLLMAGCWNRFTDRTGRDHSAFVILTTDANASIQAYHDRMPVLLRPGERDAWLHDADFAREVTERIPMEVAAMRA